MSGFMDWLSSAAESVSASTNPLVTEKFVDRAEKILREFEETQPLSPAVSALILSLIEGTKTRTATQILMQASIDDPRHGYIRRFLRQSIAGFIASLPINMTSRKAAGADLISNLYLIILEQRGITPSAGDIKNIEALAKELVDHGLKIFEYLQANQIKLSSSSANALFQEKKKALAADATAIKILTMLDAHGFIIKNDDGGFNLDLIAPILGAELIQFAQKIHLADMLQDIVGDDPEFVGKYFGARIIKGKNIIYNLLKSALLRKSVLTYPFVQHVEEILNELLANKTLTPRRKDLLLALVTNITPSKPNTLGVDNQDLGYIRRFAFYSIPSFISSLPFNFKARKEAAADLITKLYLIVLEQRQINSSANEIAAIQQLAAALVDKGPRLFSLFNEYQAQHATKDSEPKAKRTIRSKLIGKMVKEKKQSIEHSSDPTVNLMLDTLDKHGLILKREDGTYNLDSVVTLSLFELLKLEADLNISSILANIISGKETEAIGAAGMILKKTQADIWPDILQAAINVLPNMLTLAIEHPEQQSPEQVIDIAFKIAVQKMDFNIFLPLYNVSKELGNHENFDTNLIMCMSLQMLSLPNYELNTTSVNRLIAMANRLENSDYKKYMLSSIKFSLDDHINTFYTNHQLEIPSKVKECLKYLEQPSKAYLFRKPVEPLNQPTSPKTPTSPKPSLPKRPTNDGRSHRS